MKKVLFLIFSLSGVLTLSQTKYERGMTQSAIRAKAAVGCEDRILQKSMAQFDQEKSENPFYLAWGKEEALKMQAFFASQNEKVE